MGIQLNWVVICNEINDLVYKMGLGFGWLRAVAQGYTYNYNKIKLGRIFQNNLKGLHVKCGWGLDGCARWRKVTITVTIQLNWGVILKRISTSCNVKSGWGMDGCARRRKVTATVTLKLNWGVMFKGI